ncbi:glycoside hydrolase family 3 N-terminal domain-containing protein [Streptococcus pneumoniae]
MPIQHQSKETKVREEVLAEPEKQLSKEEQIVARYLKEMTIEEKVGALFFARLPVDTALADLEEYHLGGYILFGRDFEGRKLEDIRLLTETLQKNAKIPLLIGSDEEGGQVSRVSAILPEAFRSPMDLYHEEGGLEAVVQDTREKAKLLKSIGIHTGLAPVADYASSPESFIYNRTIGEDIKTTATYVKRVVEAMKEEQFGSTLKHFPGYGDNGDSHSELIYDARSLEELEQKDFLPFKAGIEAGADSVLVSHNILTAIDQVPSSISPKITQILREKLQFDGVIMTDDFDMAGLANFMSQEEAAYQAIVAGNDFIITSQYASQIPYLLDKVHHGELSEERLDQSLVRILKWKYKLGLLPE